MHPKIKHEDEMMRAEVLAMFHNDPHRVFVDGRLTTPSFLSRGAAQAYADGINSGYREPEFSATNTTIKEPK